MENEPEIEISPCIENDLTMWCVTFSSQRGSELWAWWTLQCENEGRAVRSLLNFRQLNIGLPWSLGAGMFVLLLYDLKLLIIDNFC